MRSFSRFAILLLGATFVGAASADWIEQSNVNAMMVLQSQAKFEPESVARAGLTQFDADSKPYLPIILAGQNNLVDLLSYRTSIPLASRVVARYQLHGITRNDMDAYLQHHLNIAGMPQQLFSEPAVTSPTR